MQGENLPTFNVNPLEINLHRIKGLSECFVYFNDDIFVTRPIEPKVFFEKGKPVDLLALQPVVANGDSPAMSYIYLNNAMVLAKHFQKRQNMKEQPSAYFSLGHPPLRFLYNLLELAFPRFTGFYTPHGPSPFLKETFRTLWEKEGELLKEVSTHRFREYGDVSQYLFREWQKLEGNFCSKNVDKLLRYYEVSDDNPKLIKNIETQGSTFLCINDANHQINFEKAKAEIIQAFEKVLPKKSSSEK
jgi:hypothetical protein